MKTMRKPWQPPGPRDAPVPARRHSRALADEEDDNDEDDKTKWQPPGMQRSISPGKLMSIQ